MLLSKPSMQSTLMRRKQEQIHHIDRAVPALSTLSHSHKNILVLGATGNLGPRLLAHLSTDPYFILTALTRNSSTIPSCSALPASIRTIRIAPSFPQDDLAAAMSGQDAVINLIPPFDLALHKRIINTAAASNVTRYIPGEFRLATYDPEVVAMVPGPFGAKNRIAEYLVQKTTDEKEGSVSHMMTLTWTGICTGCFLDWGLQKGFLGFDLANRDATMYDRGESAGDLTTLSDVCEAVRAVLKHGSGETANRWVHVNIFRVTQAQILASLQRATGGREWRCSYVSCEEMNQMGNDKLGKGDISGFQPAVLGLFWGGYESGRMDVERYNEVLLGRSTRSAGELDEVVRTVLDELAN